MFDHRLRAVKDALFSPLAPALQHVHPHLLTWLGFGIGVIGAGAVAVGWHGAGLALWLLNRLFDGLDGAAAGLEDRRSLHGEYVDILLDFIVYSLYPAALVLGRPSAARLAGAVVLLAAFYVNAASWMYLDLVLEKLPRRGSPRYRDLHRAKPTGLIGGTETIVFYAAFLAIPRYVVPLFLSMAALLLLSVAIRIFWAYRTLGRP